MRKFKIGKTTISDTGCFIIAEIGVNHNGSIDLAKKLVDEAVSAGADCVKFQTFKADKIVTKDAPKADYQLKVTEKSESQYEMLKKLELSESDYREIIRYTKEKNVEFLSTPYNKEDVDFLLDLGVSAFKVASGQIVEKPFLKYLAQKKLPIIASTGMAYLSDVDEAVRIFREHGADFVLLQCTTNYPSAVEDSNILAMQTMKDSFKCPVGYSDHTTNEISILASVALGATIIEKHFTLDKSLPGPDHTCSADPSEFKILVEKIRLTEQCLGTGLKEPLPVEIKNAVGMRRSLVSTCEIRQGECISEEMLGYKRPSSGLHPNMTDQIIGKKAATKIEPGVILNLSMIDWS